MFFCWPFQLTQCQNKNLNIGIQIRNFAAKTRETQIITNKQLFAHKTNNNDRITKLGIQKLFVNDVMVIYPIETKIIRVAYLIVSDVLISLNTH